MSGFRQGLTPQEQSYLNSTYASIDPANRYALFTSSGTFTVPAGVTKLRVRCIGGGGGGGGGGSTGTSGAQQAGGSGGGCAQDLTAEVTVTPGDSLTVTIGAGGAGGAGGASGGNSGAGAWAGGTTSCGPINAVGGGPGQASPASTSSGTTVAGAPAASWSDYIRTNYAESGWGGLGLGAGNYSVTGGLGALIGGGGGGVSSATLGGAGGAAAQTFPNGNTLPSAGTAATVDGGAGQSALAYGCGGGGGGGGAYGGSGGAGGSGGDGFVELMW